MSLPTTLFIDEDSRVPEGTSHRYVCRLAEEDGSAIQVGAISAIAGWLDDPQGATINSRANVNLLGAGGGSVADVGGGVAEFTWQLEPADAVISAVGQAADVTYERHQITLKFTYTKVGGGTGQLTKRVRYDVESFERI
ncbi:MAG: hypothetical protein AB7R67_18840 [Vicinamibacterales bacterium]